LSQPNNSQPPLCINLQSVVCNSPLEMAFAVSSTIRWCSLHLACLFRPRHSLGHLAIPPEFILMIVAHLNKTSIMSLVLTCRTLLRICFLRSPELSLLEKDVTYLYFCHHCIKLHRWCTSWFHTRNHRAVNLYCGIRCQRKSYFSDSAYTLPYHSARVIMNRHFYGAAHGSPVSKLEGRSISRDYRFGE
jgi:hypothetical protein